MKFKRKVLSIILAISMMSNAGSIVYANNDEETLKNELLENMIKVNQSMGIVLTQDDVIELENSIVTDVNNQSESTGISKENIYQNYLNELDQEINLDDLSSNGQKSISKLGTYVLPKSSVGDIFFIDNDAPYNHVGMYVSADTIVESMPGGWIAPGYTRSDGVVKYPVYDIMAHQALVPGGDSAILEVKSATYNQKVMAASWITSGSVIGKPYDYIFITNKGDDDDDAFNCSELVWKAYYRKANIDLDSNGGPAVYPNNIYDSLLVEKYPLS